MTVRSDGARIVLEGRCRADDAETLLRLLQQSPSSIVDIGTADVLHTAVVQILLAAGCPVSGASKHEFLARYGVLNHLDDDLKHAHEHVPD